MPSRRGKILTQFAFSMFTVDCHSATKLRCKIYITKQQKITLNLDLLKQTWIFPFHLDEFKEFGFLLGLLIRTPYVLNSSVKNRLRGGILVNLSTKKYIFVFLYLGLLCSHCFPIKEGDLSEALSSSAVPGGFTYWTVTRISKNAPRRGYLTSWWDCHLLEDVISYQTSVPLISLKLSSWQVTCNSVCKTNRQFYFHAGVRDDVKWKDEADPRGQTGRSGAGRSREVG